MGYPHKSHPQETPVLSKHFGDPAARTLEGWKARGGYTALAIPYFEEDEACRLNLHINFKGRKGNIGNAKLLTLLNEINETYNYAVISLDKDGDLALRFTLVFDRKLDPKLVHRWLRYVERQADGLVYEFNERLLPYQAPSEK